MSSRLIEYRPPRIALTMLIVAAVLQYSLPLSAVNVYSSGIAATVAGLSGFSLMMWAWWQFKRQGVAICPTDPTASLVTGGVFRITRNPMYLGMGMMLIGVAIFVGTAPFYVVAVAFFLIMDRLFCRYEEEKLANTFGQEFYRYCHKVRRWL